MLNFALGFMVAMALTLVTTTTPEKAAKNLGDWKRVFWSA